VVQFHYPLTGREKPALEAVGVRVAAYIPDGGFVVQGARASVEAAKAIDGFRFAGFLAGGLRLRPDAVGAEAVLLVVSGSASEAIVGLDRVGAVPLVASSTMVIAVPGIGGAAVLATLPEVLWVEPYHVPTLANYRATITDAIRQPANASTYSAAAGALWTFNGDPLNPRFLGYTGEGVKVDVTDQGIDGSHPAFDGRLGSGISWAGGNPWVDALGHGTHVAATAVGNGAYLPPDAGLPYGLYAGAAPGATLVAQSYNATGLDYQAMADFAASSGASISVNAWGDTSSGTLGAYTAASSSYDALTADAGSAPGAQPLLFVFSAGNQNNQAGSVTPPATAKNVLAVGATGNDYDQATPSSEVAPFSSWGPSDDGRIRPDLVAPGERVASANSSQAASSGTPPPPVAGGRSYIYLSGTSMAAPQVAGAAAVAMQYLREARGVVGSPALLKALLINGAEPLPGLPWPGAEQGWGRLDLGAALLNSSTRRVDFVPEGFRTFLSAPDVAQYNVSVDAGADLKITLVWTDAAGTPLAGSALVNDLDLEVRDANDSVIYTGNQFVAGSSAPGGGTAFDRANNVEVVRIANASAGVWKVFVRAYNLPLAPQTFALAFSGAINRSYADLAVSPVTLRNAPSQIDSGSSVTLEGQVANEGVAPSSNISLSAVSALDPLGPPLAQITLPALQPGAYRAFSLTIQPPDGPNDLEIRASSDAPEADLTNNWASLSFFVRRLQPEITGVTDASALPGQPAAFALTVTNRGNVPDRIVVTETPALRDPAWALSFSQTQFDLQPDASAPLQVYIVVPPGAQAGDSTAAQVGVVSSDSTSHLSLLAITARATTVHLLRIEPVAPSVSLAPGQSALVQVRVANGGNVAEAVTVSLVPSWGPAPSWTGGSKVVTIEPGATATVDLPISNEDTGAAGYRGEIVVLAVLSSNGAQFDARLPTFLESVVCLRLHALPAPAPSTQGEVEVENCGSAPLAGRLLGEAPEGLSVALAPTFEAPAHQSVRVAFTISVADDVADGTYVVTVFADAGQGVGASATWTVQHRSGVVLEAVTASIRVMALEGANTFTFKVRNTGTAGWVQAPGVAGVPAGWSVHLFPEGLRIGQGAVGTFGVLVDTGSSSTANNADLVLTFFANTAREGEFSPTVAVDRAPAALTPGPSSQSDVLPTDLAPAGATAAGLALAVGAAATLRRSRGLVRSCPACSQRAPLFDTLLSPSCANCGASLVRAPPNTR
jgi:subtilisin family serine protease/uncharacterized membrane protein